MNAIPNEKISISQENTLPNITNSLNYNFNFFRNLIIAIDFNENMNKSDLKPNRHKYLFPFIENMIREYYKYNYMSFITIIAVKNYQTKIIAQASPIQTN